MIKHYLYLIIIMSMCGTAVAQLSNGLYAAFDTTMGGFTCRLDYAEAPLTVANFVGLAEGTQSWISTNASVKAEPFYDGLIFHRVIDGFMIQGGCPLGNGTGDPGYKFPDQISTNLLHSKAGMLSMANSGPDSNGSQFFITVTNTPWLDGKHAVFGEVIEGMDVILDIGAIETGANARPLTNIVIQSVQILREGVDAETFEVADADLPQVSRSVISIKNDDIVGSISNQCQQNIYVSTNLIHWASAGAYYSQGEAEEWSMPVSSNRPVEFFKGSQVFFPDEVADFSDINGTTLTFVQNSTVFVFEPVSGGTGTCSIAGNTGELTFWADWTVGPYPGDIVFQPEHDAARRFQLSVDGSCDGFQWTGSSWIPLGEFEFSAAP